MKRIILRIRPIDVIEDIDLDIIKARAASLTDWESEVKDTRLTDATYVTVIVKTQTIDAEKAERLKRAFAGLPKMRAQVWRRSESEAPLDTADLALLEGAAE